MSFDHTQEFVINYFNTTVYGQYHRPITVKGVVVLVHGLGEHSGRYLENVIPALLDCELAVVTYDNIGHGKSGGKRGHCPSYQALLDVLKEVIIKSKVLFAKQPLFLYGHSMGGNLVLNYAIRRNHSIKGIIATSPYLSLAFEPPRWKMVLGKMLLNVYSSLTMPSGLDPKGISRVPVEVEKYKSDPLVHDKVSPMYSFPVIDAGRWAIDNANKLGVETLLLHGSGDPIIDYNGTEEFHKNAQTTELKIFEGAYHELHFDLCVKDMLQVVQGWLNKRLEIGLENQNDKGVRG